MDGDPQEIVIERVGAERILPFVAIAARYDTTAGAESAAWVAREGGYIVRENGVPVAGFTITNHGTEAYVTALGGNGARADMTRLTLAAAESIKGMRSVAFQTRRPGLVRKAKALGYQEAGTVANGTIMRKYLC